MADEYFYNIIIIGHSLSSINRLLKKVSKVEWIRNIVETEPFVFAPFYDFMGIAIVKKSRVFDGKLEFFQQPVNQKKMAQAVRAPMPKYGDESWMI